MLVEAQDIIRADDTVGLFVDGENFLIACRDEGITPHWPKIIETFSRDDWPSCAIYYGAEFGEDRTRNGYFESVGRAGFIVRRKRAKHMRDTTNGMNIQKANLDIEIAIDMLQLTDRYTTAFLFTGDGDFAPLIETLRKLGKRIHIVTSRATAALELQLIADKPVFFIEDLKTTLQA